MCIVITLKLTPFIIAPPQARRLQQVGAVGGIVVDNVPSSSADAAPLFAMSGDGTEDVRVR